MSEAEEWALEPMQEFRFEIDSKSKLTLRMVSGKAELFGAELAQDVDYHFTGRKLAIFTWHGCR